MKKAKFQNATVVIFSKSQVERDQLRRHMLQRIATLLFFEKETICFDNLDSIRPDAIVIRSDSKNVVWRFVFVVHSLKFAINLIVVSDFLETANFVLENETSCVHCMPTTQIADELVDTVQKQIFNNSKKKIFGGKPIFIGDSASVRNIRLVLPSLKRASEPVLITGESGTGKELLARMMGNPFDSSVITVKLNCAELVYVKTSDSSCFQASKVADLIKSSSLNGIRPKLIQILLDRIDRASASVQSEILMLIDLVNETVRQDSAHHIPMVRFVATAVTNLEYMANRGYFRHDLLYRINVIPIMIPPLRERKEDILLLADFFMLRECKRLQKSYIALSQKIKQRLYVHLWPGNVEELRRIVCRIAFAGDESIIDSHSYLPESDHPIFKAMLLANELAFLPDTYEIKSALNSLKNVSLKVICNKFIAQTEKKMMQKALELTNWNRKKAAALLNISYKSMLNKIKYYELC